MERLSECGQPGRLLRLPDEVLITILTYLELPDQRITRLVCRQFKGLADPFTFAKFAITHGEDAADLAYLLTRDSLRATWVRELLVSTKLDGRDGLEHVPVMLALMANMRKLTLETPDCNSKQAIQRIPWVNLQKGYEHVFQKSTVEIPKDARLLPQLKECTLHFVDDRTCLYSMTKYCHIFLHPTLESLRMSCACTDYAQNLLVQQTKRYRSSTALSHLHLEECDFDPKALAVLLSFPRALKSLIISEGTRYSDSSGTRSRMHGNMPPRELCHVLVDTCSMSLERLSLDLGYRRSQYETITLAGRFLDLTQMTCLKKLSLSFVTFALVVSYPRCDHQVYRRLPLSLQSLQIFKMPYIIPRFGERRYDPTIPHEPCLVRDKASHGLPNLEELTWTYEYHDSDTPTILALLNRRFESEPFHRQVALAKRFVTDRCNRTLYDYQKANVRMTAEVNITPAGYIPPYLHNEDKPRTELIWDSAHPPIEGQNLAARARWKEQMRARQQQGRNSVSSHDVSMSRNVRDMILRGQIWDPDGDGALEDLREAEAVIGESSVAGDHDDNDDNEDDEVQHEAWYMDNAPEGLGYFDVDDSEEEEEDENVTEEDGLMMDMTPELQNLLGLLMPPIQPQHP